jgi:Carboxypeptidase regulatory-like domain
MFTLTRSVRFLSVLLALAFSSFAAPLHAQGPATVRGQSAPRSGDFKISGTIVNALTGAPLANARASIIDTRDRANPLWSMITAEDGRFEFTSLYQGKFALQGEKRGFLAAGYDQHETFSTAIVTGPGLESENLTLRLTPLGSIHGIVTDEVGDPVSGADITLYMTSDNFGFDRTFNFNRASTDDQGTFEFSALPPGTYFVSVRAHPWYALHPQSSFPQGTRPAPSSVPRSLDVTYPLTFYNGASDSQAATPIAVSGGDRVQVDLHLNPVPALHILVHVTQDPQQGAPMPSFQKRVFDSAEPISDFNGLQVEPGVFELTGIPAGTYSTQVFDSKARRVQTLNEVNLSENAQELDVTRADPGSSVKISLKTPRNEPLPKPLWVTLQRVGAPRQIVADQQVGKEGADGEVTLENVPAGKFRLRVGSPGRVFSVLRMNSQGSDLPAADTLDITSGASLDIAAYLAEGVVRVEGYVHSKGKPAVGVMVALIPKNPESHLEMFHRDQTDSDGSFTVRAVVPGSYTIVAVEDAWGFPWQQPGILDRYVQHGQNLTVGPLMTGSVQLPDPIEVQPH